MEMLSRYLQAVGQYLPAGTKDDTLAELRANLLETMDDRAEELGRPLTDAEVSATLKAHGRPEVVAVRYLPQRSLIGPAVFPFYLFALKRALPFVLAIYAATRTIPLIVEPPKAHLAGAIVAAVLQLVPVLLVFWAVVTLVFAVLEQTHPLFGPGSEWDPAKLPRVEKAASGEREKSMPARVGDLVVQMLGLTYILSVPAHPFLLLGPATMFMSLAPVAWAPRWPGIYVGIVALTIVQIVLRTIGLRRMGRQTDMALLLGAKILSVATMTLLVSTKIYFLPRGEFPPDAVSWTNFGVHLGFWIALVTSALNVLWEIWKAARSRAGVPSAMGKISL
jgi:hypothetical protein